MQMLVNENDIGNHPHTGKDTNQYHWNSIVLMKINSDSAITYTPKYFNNKVQMFHAI